MNPFIRLYEHPVETLAAFAYVLGLFALLGVTWWALYRNAFTIYVQYKKRRWTYDPPPGFILRLITIPAILAVDCLALAALIYIL